jgi:hypothetical protein
MPAEPALYGKYLKLVRSKSTPESLTLYYRDGTEELFRKPSIIKIRN